MSQPEHILAGIQQLPPPPQTLPTSHVQPLAAPIDQIKDIVTKPLLAATPQMVQKRYVNMRRALVVELGLLATLALAAVLVGLGLAALGGGGMGLAALCAGLAPLPLMIALGLWLDRYEPEPPWLLARAMLWGAGAAVVLAIIVNGLFSAFAGESLGLVVGAPFIEEALKGMAIWWVYKHRAEHLHGVKDAIIYALFVGIGFAVVEDVIYYLAAQEESHDGWLFVVALRGLATPLLHSFLAAFTAVGIARVSQGGKRSTLVKWYLLAVLLHGLWNSGIGVFLYPVLYLPLFVWGLNRLRKHRKIEEQMLTGAISIEVPAGLIDESQYLAVLSKTRLREFIASLRSSSHELHVRRLMQSAAWSLAAHRNAVNVRSASGQGPSSADRSVDDYLRLLLQVRARQWSAHNILVTKPAAT